MSVDIRGGKAVIVQRYERQPVELFAPRRPIEGFSLDEVPSYLLKSLNTAYADRFCEPVTFLSTIVPWRIPFRITLDEKVYEGTIIPKCDAINVVLKLPDQGETSRLLVKRLDEDIAYLLDHHEYPEPRGIGR